VLLLGSGILINDFLGWVFILLVVLSTILLAVRWPGVARILWAALAVRVAVILFGYYVAPLPDSDGDAIGFEILAWEWSQDGFEGVIEKFRGPSTNFISWILAILYSLTDRSLLMAQSVSIFFGMGTVFTGWLLARKLWGERAATKAGWVLALFPTLILYSVLTLRETYVLFFLIVALHGVVDWTRTGYIKPILLAMAGFIGATFFHGAMVVGAVMFLLIVWLTAVRRTVKALVVHSQVHLKSAVLVGVVGAGIAFIVLGGISVPKLGTFDQAVNVEHLLRNIDVVTRGSDGEVGASYPQWAKPSTPIDLLYKGPIRVVYFIFSPFPWDIRKAMQLIGLLDSLLYMALVFLIWRNRKAIWADRASRNILLVLIAYFLIFGLAIGNYGAAIRHRSKFVGALIVLAAPMLPKLIFSRRKNSQ
jgi:hypothetical protein